jgi:hypothetical protein
MKKILLIVGVLALAGGGTAYYLSQKTVPSVNDLKTEATITSTDLFAAYQADEAAANQQYNGKIVQVSGTVKEVKTNDAGVPTVVLESGDMMFGVICELQDPGQAAQFAVGQTATLKGECSGLLMDVVMVRCVPAK